jgi:lactoylglutathione lyase
MSTHTTPAVQTGHIGLNVSNVERSAAFYRAIFGFSVARESYEAGRRYVHLADGERLVLTLWEQSEGRFDTRRPGLHHLSFQVESVEDVHAFEQQLRQLDVHFLYDGVVPHREGSESGGLFFEDPDGIRLEIYTPTGVSGQPAPNPEAPTCGFF